jgi:hypothetical protein
MILEKQVKNGTVMVGKERYPSKNVMRTMRIERRTPHIDDGREKEGNVIWNMKNVGMTTSEPSSPIFCPFFRRDIVPFRFYKR